MPLHWYVARIRPQVEHAAASGLERAGFEVFAPWVRTPHLRMGHRHSLLFPGYLFVRYNVAKWGWPLLDQVPQVLGLVRTGGVAPAVPDEVIADLAQRVKESNQTGGICTRFQPGQRVRVFWGTIETQGEVVEEPKSARKRVRVLMEFLGRIVSAQVPWQNLRPLQVDDPTMMEQHQNLRRTRGRGRWIQGIGPRLLASGPHPLPELYNKRLSL